MNCMKCGKPTGDQNVFCDECLADMQRHPVASGTPLILPPRPKSQPVKRRRVRKPKKAEEQIRSLKKTVAGLILALTVAVVLLSLAILALLHVCQDSEQHYIPGQNYTTSETGFSGMK